MTVVAARAVDLAIDRLLTRRRVTTYMIIFVTASAALLVAGIVNFFSGDPSARVPFPDYVAYYTAGGMLRNGLTADLYTAERQYEFQTALHADRPKLPLALFISPPFVALPFLFLAQLPYVPSALLWTVISVAFLASGASVVRSLVPSMAVGHWRAALLVWLGSYATLDLIGSGQTSSFSFLVWSVGIALAQSRRDVLAGIVFALGLYKPQHVVLPIVVLVLWRRWRSVAAWFAAVGGLGLVSMLMVGEAGVRQWLALLGSPLYTSTLQQMTGWKMLTVYALTRAVLPPGWELLALAAHAVVALVVVGAVARAAVSCGQTPKDRLWVWAVALTGNLALAPHLFSYDLGLLLLPTVVVAAAGGLTAGYRLLLMLLFVFTWCASIVQILVGGAAWPVSIVGAPWAALLVVLLFAMVLRSARQAGTQSHGAA